MTPLIGDISRKYFMSHLEIVSSYLRWPRINILMLLEGRSFRVLYCVTCPFMTKFTSTLVEFDVILWLVSKLSLCLR